MDAEEWVYACERDKRVIHLKCYNNKGQLNLKMNRTAKWVKLIACITSFPLVLIANTAMAAPFEYNPKAFRDWVNAKNFDAKIISLKDCKNIKWLNGDTTYHCFGGFANISDPLGVRVCRIKEIVYIHGKGLMTHVHETSCRWRN